MPHDDNLCHLTENERIQASIFTVVTQSKVVSAYNKLLDVGYAQFYSHDVAATIDELLRTDFSCLQLPYEEVARERAELLALDSRLKASDAQAVNDVRDQSSIKADLESAIAALDLDQQMLDKISENCSVSLRKPEILDPFNEVISGNSVQETADLKAQRASIKSMLNRMSQ
jgi:hypothetical protein